MPDRFIATDRSVRERMTGRRGFGSIDAGPAFALNLKRSKLAFIANGHTADEGREHQCQHTWWKTATALPVWGFRSPWSRHSTRRPRPPDRNHHRCGSSTFKSTAAATRPWALDDPNPLVSWRMAAHPRAAGHPCHRADAARAGPADEQTAYQVQAATSTANLRRGTLIWDNGQAGVCDAVRCRPRGDAARVTATGRLARAGLGRRREAVGIRDADGSTAYPSLVIQPKVVGDLTSVQGRLPHGVVRSDWTKGDRWFRLTVEVPANTMAEVRAPTPGPDSVVAPRRATFLRVDGDYAVYSVASGS
jgi:hypothetical protein